MEASPPLWCHRMCCNDSLTVAELPSFLAAHPYDLCILFVFFVLSFCKVQNNVRLLGGTDGQFSFFVCRKKCMNSRWSVEKQFLLANGGGNHDMNNLRFACILHVFFIGCSEAGW